MRNGRVLLILFASILLLIPTASAAQWRAVEITLTQGTTSIIATMDVSRLQETSQSSTGANQGSLQSQGVQAYDDAKTQVERSGYVPPGEASKTVTPAPSRPAPPTTSLGLVLEGAPGGAPNPCGCSPPDVIVGAGPNHVFEMVNLAGIIYAKSGAVAKATFGLDSFFLLPASSMSDPQVSYDANSGRWFASIIDIPNSQVVFAVSKSNDPTGTFNLYSVPDTGNLPDQPVTGTNNDKYVISVNDYNPAGTVFLGVHYWVLNKSELVAGASTIHFSTNTPDPNMFSLHPAQHLSSSTTFYLVTDCTGSCIQDPQSTSNTATIVSITGVPPATLTVSSSSFSIAPSVIGPNAQQPGTGTLLVTNDNRVESVVWESNSLWAAWSDACVPSGDMVVRTCLRLVQATTSGATATKVQDFDYAANGQYYFYPAVTSYQGQLAVSFGRSSSSIYPSAMVAGRGSSDPPNTLQTPSVIRAGTAADTSARYGDYFGAATDPTPTTASTFWVAGEYRTDATPRNWNSVIGQVGSFNPPGFSLVLNTTAVSNTGRAPALTLSIKSLGSSPATSFAGPVTVSSNSTLSGLRVSFNASSVTLSGGGSRSLLVNFTSATPGAYAFHIVGIGGPSNQITNQTAGLFFNITNSFGGVRAIISGAVSLYRTSGTLPGSTFLDAVNATTGTPILLKNANATMNFNVRGMGHFVDEIPTSPNWLSTNCEIDANLGSANCFLSRTLDIFHGGSVDINDYSLVNIQFGQTLGSPNYNPLADLMAGGRVNIFDISIENLYFGCTVIAP